jgi:NAD(P)-dependent dehydrogenase (short-subunit alcohol dehydrogenase family)
MKKRTVIISGGCGGVGRAAGYSLAEDGYDVVALYLSTPAEEARSIVKSFPPGNHEAVRCDIRDAKEAAMVVENIFRSRGTIDACVHTAVDPIVRGNMLELTEAEFRDQLGAAVFGGFNLLTAAAKKMKSAGRGAIVGVLSKYVEADVPHSRLAAYVTAKYALRGILKELYMELASHHISVNALAPDFLDTKLNADLSPEVRAFVQDKMSVGSIRTPEQAARIIAFLLSEPGKSINGKIYSFEAKEVHNL